MRRVGPYELIQKLGSGGMAEVWMGRRVAVGGASKSVAVKLLAPHHLSKPDYRQMFMEEARLSMLLTNSNIVQVFDIGEEADGTAYMAMEWIDGCDLADLTSRLREHGQRLSDEVISFIIGEILRALRYAHELTHQGQRATIVHRDISPQNVMLSVSGEVKLMDFGVARIATEQTTGHFVKGKLRYMPPEQLKGNSREPTVDLFAVGAVLHELLDGQKFRSTAADEGELYGMILSGTHPPLTIDPREIPLELDQLRWGLLAARIEDRLSSARGALQRLRKFPRYRDASMELEELVRWAVGAEAPRTGLAEPEQPKPLGGTVVLHQSEIWGDQWAEGQQQQQQQGHPGAPGWGAPQQQHAGHPHDDRTGTGQTPMGDRDPSNPMIPQTASGHPSQGHPIVGEAEADEDDDDRNPLLTIVLPIMLVFVGLGFGLIAAGALLGWFDGDDEDKDQATADAEVPDEPAGSADAAPAETPPPEVVEEAGEIIEDAPADGAAPPEPVEVAPAVAPNEEVAELGGSKDDDAAKAEAANGPQRKGTNGGKGSGTKTKKKKTGPSAKVTLVSSAYPSVEVKIGKVKTTLKAKKVINVPVGSYTIQLREPGGDWKSAGKINVVQGSSYEVKLIKPPLAMIKTK
ncbi:serine/threonine protein kinase [Plesiocystis pacifica SIR-1]|uniref:Serine/threonine protein kinase n=1 Tax=Plesiocystis pacifica SIR-1 TaxID=391625 RepID=A6GK20_9BACT|nr:serine/threonine-protein kinase [Plesiocystis pacifica]EDM73781.1 serine/threonine protein kinase [Plesiocystis pacifica SIR-1]